MLHFKIGQAWNVLGLVEVVWSVCVVQYAGAILSVALHLFPVKEGVARSEGRQYASHLVTWIQQRMERWRSCRHPLRSCRSDLSLQESQLHAHHVCLLRSVLT